MSLNTTPRTWVTAEIVTAAEMNTEIRDAFTGIQAGWTSFSPVLTGSVTNPGTSTAVGRYMQIGKTVTTKMFFVLTSTVGSGQYVTSLPFAADTSMNSSFRNRIQGWLFHAAGLYRINGFLGTGGTTAPLYANAYSGTANDGGLGPTFPIATLVSGDAISVGAFTYETT